AYNPEWFTYNELSQVTPMPLEWDRTSLSQPAQKTDNGHLPDAQGKGQAEAVYNFLDAQAKKQSSYAKSPLWSIVDGPWKLQSDTTSGQFTYVPNKAYSGPNKPTISKFVEIPFTNDSAEFNQISSGGPKSLTIAGLPQQYVKKLPQLKSAGYLDNTAASYSVNYFPLNFHNPKMGAVFSQLYFRQAFQHLVDQPVWASKVLYNTGVPTYGPIPSAPPSPLTASGAAKNPYPFDPNAAATLLKAHGWKVVPNGTDTCTDPSKCGQGVKKGQKLSFTLDYQQGVATNTSEMQDLQTEAKKVGINVSLTTHPFQQVVAAGVPCTANQPQCKWQAENWGAGWIFSPDFLPTGELLFKKGAASDASSYSDPKADNLIRQTIYGPQKSEAQALTNYANYMAKTLPVVWGPTSIGSYVAGGGTLVSNKLGGYTANAYGYLEPEDWYLTK
ncbi:MAG: hypothetical protein J2O48_08280, partial [Solirubrobacterales bacterium]|nr:hypothetical protein [Solirubrobacterales bacterium]